MKTLAKAEITAVNAEFLDDIIFEGRNQSYGAYDLRKSYNSNLNLSLIVVLSIAAAIASLAFFYSMMNPAPPKIEIIPPTTVIDFTEFINTEVPELPDQLKKKEATPTTPTPTQNNDGPIVVTDENTPEQDQIMTADEKIEQSGSENVPTQVPIIEPPVTPEPIVDNTVYKETDVTTQALFAGGSVENFRKWLSKNIDYPQDAVSNNVNGKVILQFTVDKNGKLTDIKVLRGIHPVIDQAAVKALSRSPKWAAATLNGQAVKVSYYVPISFCIQR